MYKRFLVRKNGSKGINTGKKGLFASIEQGRTLSGQSPSYLGCHTASSRQKLFGLSPGHFQPWREPLLSSCGAWRCGEHPGAKRQRPLSG